MACDGSVMDTPLWLAEMEGRPPCLPDQMSSGSSPALAMAVTERSEARAAGARRVRLMSLAPLSKGRDGGAGRAKILAEREGRIVKADGDPIRWSNGRRSSSAGRRERRSHCGGILIAVSKRRTARHGSW